MSYKNYDYIDDIENKIEDRKLYYSKADIEIVERVDVLSLVQKIQDA